MLVVKVLLKGELRRLTVDSEGLTVNKLHSTFRKLFNETLPEQFSLQYKDDEGDVCTVTNDRELAEAVRISKGLLRIEIVAKAVADKSSGTSSATSSNGSSSPRTFRPDDAFRHILSQFDLQNITNNAFFTEVVPSLTRDIERYVAMVPSFVGDFERDMKEFERRLRQQTVGSPSNGPCAAAQPSAEPVVETPKDPSSTVPVNRCTRAQVPQSEVTHNAYCDNCKNNTLIKGIRYKCMECPDFDLCAGCQSKGVHHFHDFLVITNAGRCPYRGRARSDQLPTPVSSAGSSETVHVGVMCDGCKSGHFLRGIRHKCSTCPDFDLCSSCLQKGYLTNEHISEHVMTPMTETVRRPFLRRYPVTRSTVAAEPMPEEPKSAVSELAVTPAPAADVVVEVSPVEVPLEETFEHLEVSTEPVVPAAVLPEVSATQTLKLDQLQEMGFCDRVKNLALLAQFDGDLLETVKALLDNQ